MPTTKPQQPSVARIQHNPTGCRVLVAVPADYQPKDILDVIRCDQRQLYVEHTWTVEEGAEKCRFVEGFVYRWCVGEKKT